MPQIQIHFSLKTVLILLALLLTIAAQAIAVNYLFKKGPENVDSTDQDTLRVTAQKIYFEIDPENSLFRSSQVISLVNSEVSRREMIFLIYPGLVIDRLDFKKDLGAPAEIEDWYYAAPVQYPRLSGTVKLNQVRVRFAADIEPRQALTMALDYHLTPEGFQTGLGTNLYELFVSPQTQHAVGFDSGAYPVIESNGASPLEITIRHPDTERCGIPGEWVSEESAQGFTTVTYQVNQIYDPAFSCAVYHKEQKSADGASVEFYLTPDQTYSEKMSDIALQYFKLYRQLFGDPGTSTFRFVFMPMNVEGGAGGAENKGNTVYLGRTDSFDKFDQDEDRQRAFKILVGHEEFHNWNRFHGTWSGSLIDWWSEGGANFMSSWAAEILWGKEAGRAVRAQYLTDLDKAMGYLFPGTLESPNTFSERNTWKGEWTLAYDYGALVWEQLRQLMGDDSLAAGLREFIQQPVQQGSTIENLIRCLQLHTQADVAAFLGQWTSRNARIDLTIKQVTVRPGGDPFETTAVINVAADADYEFFTSLGYRSDASSDWTLIPVHITRLGESIVKFTSPQEPTTFQIDPEVRVPQINIRNDYWPIK